MIKMLKLSSAETILAEVIEADEKGILVSNPVLVRIEQSNPLRSMMVGLQWMPMQDGENLTLIQNQHIIALNSAGKEMSSFYNDAVQRILHPEEVVKELTTKLAAERVAHTANNLNTVYH